MTAARTVERPAPDEGAVSLGRAATVGIYALVALRLAEAVFWALAALALREMPGLIGRLVVGGVGIELAPLLWAMVGLELAVAVGLLLRKRWAWVLLMLVTGVGLALSLYLTFGGHLDPVRLAIQVVTALFLNQRAIRVRFGVSP